VQLAVISSPGIRTGPCGSRDIWIFRAMRSSSSSRFFSAICASRSDSRLVIVLNESASSPSWSRAFTSIRCEKSPCWTRTVPTNSSCTDPVMLLASASPTTSATNWMTRKATPTTTTIASTTCPKLISPLPSRQGVSRP
jgi:hypothetical protein